MTNRHNLKYLIRIAEARNIEEIKDNELILIETILAPMLFCASIISILIGFHWEENGIRIAMIAGTLFSLGLFMIFIIHKKMNYKLNIWLLCSAMFIGLLMTYEIYYERLTIVFFLIIIMLMVMTIIMMDRSLFYCMVSSTAIFFIHSIVNYPTIEVKLDLINNFIFAVLLVFLMIVIEVCSVIYRKIILKKTAIFIETTSQKESIQGLYEEVLAQQQQLEAQNELLNSYNQLIEKKQERLTFLAYTDTLTGIPNRKMLLEQVDLLINLNTESKQKFALVFVDLDNFKKINDSLGHKAGDELLIQVVGRLNNRLSSKDMLGRLGGDELAILIRHYKNDEGLLFYVEDLCRQLEPSFKLEDKSVLVTASFGVAIWPIDGKSSGELLKAADTAMYKAKQAGKNGVAFYRKEMKNEVIYKLELENKMIKAFENEEYFIEYQPIVSANNRHTAGFEALLRWETPERGRISPVDFIPLAEEIGLISDLGDWVLRQACQKIKYFQLKYQKNIYISVNISPIQMMRASFFDRVKEIIEEEDILPDSLVFEITESVFIHDMDQAVSLIHQLKAYGIRISLDDFGTGYSSLSYLLGLPIDVLKIDKSFIDSIIVEEKNNRIVGNIIQMVHSLDMQVVAEGVEENDQYEFLKDKNCDLIQGYLMSRPLSDEKMKEYVLLEDQRKAEPV